MSAEITTRADQTLDDIVFENFGYNRQMIDAVRTANPHAVKLGVHLPAGIVINLPDLTPAQTRAETINLWD